MVDNFEDVDGRPLKALPITERRNTTASMRYIDQGHGK